jgi:hypothetical protein
MTAIPARLTPRLGLIAATLAWTALLSGCAPEPAFTPFVPPSNVEPGTSSVSVLPSPTQPVTPSPLPASLTDTPGPTGIALPCTNDLDFNTDLTVPDGTLVTPGSPIDKQWQVTNSGTCNWDASYRFKWIFGDALGATVEQALYPARAGTQLTLRVNFTAPLEQGTYQSAWQAFTPDGSAFGDAVFMQIIVSP